MPEAHDNPSVDPTLAKTLEAAKAAWEANFHWVANGFSKGLLNTQDSIRDMLARAIMVTFAPLVQGLKSADLKFTFEVSGSNLLLRPADFFTALLFAGVREGFIPPNKQTLGRCRRYLSETGHYEWKNGTVVCLGRAQQESYYGRLMPYIEQDATQINLAMIPAPSAQAAQLDYVARYLDPEKHTVEFRQVLDEASEKMTMVATYKGDIFMAADFMVPEHLVKDLVEIHQDNGLPIIYREQKQYVLAYWTFTQATHKSAAMEANIQMLREIRESFMTKSPDLPLIPIPDAIVPPPQGS